MAEIVPIVVEELTGDPDDTTCYLTIDGSKIPGDTPTGRLVELAPGLSVLVIADGGQGEALSVEELQGDPDTEHVYLVTPKTLCGAPAGRGLTGLLYTRASGSVLVVELPEGAASPDGGGSSGGSFGAASAPTTG